MRERALTEPSDAFWAFRRLLEVSAGDGPLVVLLEDLHWAAPDLLDLVEYLLGWATGPLLLLCVARPELLESRPEWRDDAIVLGPISGEEARTLVELLPERAGLPESVVGAAVEMAEGNPLFLEQLVVFAAEDVLDPLPPTLEVSIASRIDRLPAGERAVLERAAVVGPALLALDRGGSLARRRAGRGRQRVDRARAAPARACRARDGAR